MNFHSCEQCFSVEFLYSAKIIFEIWLIGEYNLSSHQHFETTFLSNCLLKKLYHMKSTAVIQWTMTTRVIALWRVYVTSMMTSVLAMRFLIEILFNLQAIKSHLKGHIINRIAYTRGQFI